MIIKPYPFYSSSIGGAQPKTYQTQQKYSAEYNNSLYALITRSRDYICDEAVSVQSIESMPVIVEEDLGLVNLHYIVMSLCDNSV